MKRNYYLLSGLLLIFAVLSGILTSGISFIGRVGVNTFYKNYRFFKTWWQGALVCLLLFAVVTLLLYWIDKKFKGNKRLLLLTFFLLLFLGGLYLTYSDFRNALSHRWLGERFHLGIYLYWIGCCISDLFFLVTVRPLSPAALPDLPATTEAL